MSTSETETSTHAAKRAFPHLPLEADAGDGKSSSPKRRRVRFDDAVVRRSEDEDEVDFILSIGDDGDWDYSIETSSEKAEGGGARDDDDGSKADPTHRAASPFSVSDRRLGEELRALSPPADGSYGSSRAGPQISLDGTRVDGSSGRRDVIPLITPPSSPRRVRAVSSDGTVGEEATICEWPCNLAVDCAITAALELDPLALSLPQPRGG